jgi:DNA-binding CsgD family transcriptional regulator/PAS domain-containing protein
VDNSLALPLVQRIYEAALDPSRWQDFVEALSGAFRGAPVGFALQLPGFPLSSVLFGSQGLLEEFGARFAAHAVRGLPWEEARRRHFVRRFGLSSEVISDERLRESDFYREIMVPQGLGPHGLMGHTIALDAGRPVAGLSVFATAATGPFTQADLAFGDLLVPHLAQGYRILAEMRRHEALTDAIDRFPTGVVLLDAHGHVLLANRGARQIFARDDGIALDGNALRAASASDDAALRRAIAAAVEAAVAGRMIESSVLSLSRRSASRPFPVMVGPLRPHTGEPTLADAVAVLYVSDLESGVLRRREALRELYGLTEAETQLVELLCQGSSLDEAALARGVTMNTARSQLKQVFAKTHTSRQSELMRLVISGVASIAGP